MQINRRVTNGLAWASVVLVIGVPVADFVSARLMGDQESVAVVANVVAPVPAPADQRPAEPDPIETAAVEPVEPVAVPAAKPAASADVVDNFLASGRKLPAYITGGDDAPAAEVAAVPEPVKTPKPVVATPKPTQTAVAPVEPATSTSTPAAEEPIEVAVLGPQKTAPIPMPLSMRPRPVSQPMASQPSADPIVIPEEAVADYDAPVTEEDLADWEYGPLSDFLAEREGRSEPRSEVTYERNGFFLDEAPPEMRRGNRYVGPVEDDLFLPFFD